MESIAEKLQLLNCPPDMYQVAYKHIASLELVSLEELEKILRLFLEKGIIVPENGKMLVEPADFCVLANGYDVLKKRITEMEDVVRELGAYKEKLIRINSKSAVGNIMAMKGMDEPYKTPDGKYSKVPFSIRRFQNKYGIVTEYGHDNVEDVGENHTETLAENIGAEVSPVTNVFDMILQKPQTNALTDETFERFERLSDSLRRVMLTVYGVQEVNDSITDNLIKLVTSEDKIVAEVSGSELDAELLYAAITHGKELSPEEVERIKDSILEELQFVNNMDVELGRAA